MIKYVFIILSSILIIPQTYCWLNKTNSQFKQRQFLQDTSQINSLDLTPSGLYLFSVSYPATIKIYQRKYQTYQLLIERNNLTDPNFQINKIIISDNASSLFVSSFIPDLSDNYSGYLKIYAFNKQDYSLKDNFFFSSGIITFAVTEDQNWLVVSEITGKCSIFKYINGKYQFKQSLTDAESSVQSIRIFNNASYLVTASRDTIARIYRKDTSDNFIIFQSIKDSTDILYSVDLTQNGVFLVTGSWDHKARLYIYKNEQYQLIQQLKEATNALNSVRFASNGFKLYTGCDDGSVRIYTKNKKNEFEILTTLNEQKSAQQPILQISTTKSGSILAANFYNVLGVYQYGIQQPFCSISDSNGYCELCFTNFTLKNSSCICQSQNFDNTSNICLSCRQNCIKCSSPTNCLACSDGYRLNSIDHQCIKCTLSFCKQCDDNNRCLACYNNFLINSNFTCACPQGTLLHSNNRCIPCLIANCLICNEISTCQKCNSTCICPSGDFFNSQTNQCMPIIRSNFPPYIIGIILATSGILLFTLCTCICLKIYRIKQKLNKQKQRDKMTQPGSNHIPSIHEQSKEEIPPSNNQV